MFQQGFFSLLWKIVFSVMPPRPFSFLPSLPSKHHILGINARFFFLFLWRFLKNAAKFIKSYTVCQVTNIVHSSFLESGIEREIKSALLVKVFSRGKNFNSKARTRWSYSLCWFTDCFCPFLRSHQKSWLQAPPVWGGEGIRNIKI